MQSFNSKAVWRGLLSAGIASVALISVLPDRRAVAADSFPFDEELLLDAKPMRGSKRIPTLDIRADGAVMIDLWCNSVQGQLVVADNTITVLTGPKTNQPCTP